jgi:TrmH family RNA methyltransferase
MSRVITSLQNRYVKEAVRLRTRRGRKTRGRIIIDGAREVRRAMDSNIKFVEMFVCEELAKHPDAQLALELARQTGVEQRLVTREVFEKLAFGARAEGVVAVAIPPVSHWPAWSLPPNPLVLVLEHVEKPGNLGGVLRTADAVGAAGVVLADSAADLYNPNAIRASLGTVFTVPVAAAAGTAVLPWLHQQGLQIFAARVDGSVNYSDADYTGPSAFVLGSEAAGLSPMWNDRDVTAVCLPMLGAADSLNVSVTAAVMMYEALRQRRQSAGN